MHHKKSKVLKKAKTSIMKKHGPKKEKMEHEMAAGQKANKSKKHHMAQACGMRMAMRGK